MKFSIRNRRDGDRRKTRREIGHCRIAGKQALCKSRTKRLIGGHGCVNRTVGNSRGNGRPTNGSIQSTLESLDVGWVETNDISDGARQDIAENPEAGTQHGLGFKLPGDGRSGLQYREGRRGKHVSETGLYGGVQRLIHIMRDGIERSLQPGNLLMWIQRIGIQRISYPEGPRQILGHSPSVLRVEIEIEEVEG